MRQSLFTLLWKFRFRAALALVITATIVVLWLHFRVHHVRVVGQPSAVGYVQSGLEEPFFRWLAQRWRLPLDIKYNTADADLVADANRLLDLKSGAVEVVSLRFPESVKLEPALAVVDIPGALVDFGSARAAAAGAQALVDRALMEKWNSHLLGIWPMGPQVLMCRTPEVGIAQLKGRRVRVPGDALAHLLLSLGAIPARIPFQNVNRALDEGLVDCAISSLQSAGEAGWFRHLHHALNLPLQFGMNGYAVSKQVWEQMSSNERERLQRAFDSHIESLWKHSEEVHQREIRCGAEYRDIACFRGRAGMILVHAPSPQDKAELMQHVEAIRTTRPEIRLGAE